MFEEAWSLMTTSQKESMRTNASAYFKSIAPVLTVFKDEDGNVIDTVDYDYNQLAAGSQVCFKQIAYTVLSIDRDAIIVNNFELNNVEVLVKCKRSS